MGGGGGGGNGVLAAILNSSVKHWNHATGCISASFGTKIWIFKAEYMLNRNKRAENIFSTFYPPKKFRNFLGKFFWGENVEKLFSALLFLLSIYSALKIQIFVQNDA